MDLACMIAFARKRSVVSKLITNLNSSPTHLFFCTWRKWICILLPFRIQPAMNSQQWIESIEQMTPNFSVLILTEPQFVSHPSNPNFYRLNIDSNDWNIMMHSIIKFLKEKSPHWQMGCEEYSYCHKRSRANSWTFENVGIIQAVFYHKYSMHSWCFVTICSYDDLSFKVSSSKDLYNAIIVCDVSCLWAAIKKDVGQGVKSNTNLLFHLMKIPRIHLLAVLFECILWWYYL